MRYLLSLSFLLLFACQHSSGFKSADAESIQSTVNSNIQLGMGYLNQGDRPRAKRKFLKALSLAPKAAETHAAFAYFLETTGDFREAKLHYQKAMVLAPTQSAQLNNYGSFLCRQGHYKEAEPYFIKAAKDVHYVNTALAYENAGLCALKEPDYKKAARYFTKALKQDPSRKQALYELTQLEMHLNHTAKAKLLLARHQKLVVTEPKLQASALLVGQKTLE